jgi:hypothetical protein
MWSERIPSADMVGGRTDERHSVCLAALATDALIDFYAVPRLGADTAHAASVGAAHACFLMVMLGCMRRDHIALLRAEST